MPTLPSYPRTYRDEHSVELELRKPRNGSEHRSIPFNAREFMRFIRMSTKPKKASGARVGASFLQRCAIQVRYTLGGSVGKWYSHGYYIAREAVKRGEVNADGVGLGFSADRDDIAVADTMVAWRKAKADLFFRLIVSPEFGERLNLEQHVRDLMHWVEIDLGTKLEWVAVTHRNTDNPHVHIVLRGRSADGSTLRINPQYIQHGIRKRAEEMATLQLGNRLTTDVLDAQKREINQARWTGLDRRLKARAQQGDGVLLVSIDSNEPGGELSQVTAFHLECRLRKLSEMGLARPLDETTWAIDADFEKSLRTVQKTHDRLKIVAEYGVLASDPRLPFRIVRLSSLDEIEGRILVHGQDEYSGNNFLLLESVKGEIVRLPQTREIAMGRRHGNLAAGHYLRLKRIPAKDSSRATYEVSDFGDAEQLISDPFFLSANADRLHEQIQDGWGGWLGRLRAAVDASVKRDAERGPKIG